MRGAGGALPGRWTAVLRRAADGLAHADPRARHRAGAKPTRPGSKSRITVEPISKAPSSCPFSTGMGVCVVARLRPGARAGW